MNKLTAQDYIDKAFSKGKAFIPFITCGDPDLETTEKLVYAMEEAGADLIELGIPFSDPVAEGLVIQEASQRALNCGTTTDEIFAMVKKIREKSNVPLAFMTYANLVFTYGLDRFLLKCKDCGICCVILPDIPFEEKGEMGDKFQEYGVKQISLIAPTSKHRISKIAAEAEGFVYCVSSLGVTGTRNEITTDVGAMVARLKEIKDIPCAIGFGISNPETAAEMSTVADGVIVGSAIVKMVGAYGRECIEPVSEFVRTMKAAMGQY
ncbi:tryptophan synthase subunit alpha [Anaerotignum propionicum]|uniref:Tryptophan synthase alpha chain n=1 Tax=Anaerotignum propionicum DSM 1682 TaxID=991789 RepID=A0A0X8VE79_ANAPI|nr:tryptophan synthase subunit alpha [Anaerotignum propionicum]AMJ42115.1 tryptophan synthase alpha chain [Anaerotignum propionicum DSM 1682]SHE51742.1 tryptophan synthase, alpha chain [[Clostridium] propionicum DSM 1682] [Anaerotignum propionicum DSM 1682]